MPIYTTNSTQQMIGTLVGRITGITIQLGRVQRQNPPQTQQTAGLNASLAEAEYALAVTRNNR